MKPTLRTATLLSLALLAGLTLLAPPTARAQINYQGRLTDGNGAPVGSGPHSVEFSLWNVISGGTNTPNRIWGPFTTLADVVDGGRFNVIIGSLDTTNRKLVDAMAAPSVFLQITVDSAAPITPRQEILPAPRALRADVMQNIIPNASGVALAGNVTISGSASIAGSAGNLRPTGLIIDPPSGNGIPSVLSLRGSFLNAGDFTPRRTADITSGFTSNVWSTEYLAFHVGFDGAANDGYLQTKEKVRIVNSGNVGIGTTNPVRRLQVGDADVTGSAGVIRVGHSNGAGSFRNWDFGTGNSALFGAIDSFGIRDYVSSTVGLVIQSSDSGGKVGIGTNNPSKGKLHVEGFHHNVAVGGNKGWIDSTGVNTSSGGGSEPVSIFASNSIWAAAEVIASSDERIKIITGRSDAATDLRTLLGIEVTDYRLKDVIGKGNNPRKKVIAQQVEKVFPQAVSQQTDVVPDIYQAAPIQDGWVQLATDLKVGDRVKLIDAKNTESVEEVLETKEGSFRTAFQPEGDKVFVYGREVKDFRTVDYDAIAMLNVSATQELARKLEAKDAELTKLSRENTALAHKVAALEARDAAREERLARLESALDPQQGPDRMAGSFGR